jgi:putative chitinase
MGQPDQASRPEAPSPAGSLLLNNPAHPDHALFRQAQAHVHGLDAQLGRTSDVHSDNLAGMLALRARADGLQRIDQVALSTDRQRLWAVQTTPGRTGHLVDLRTSVPTDAANTSMAQSSAQWPSAMAQYQTQLHAQQAKPSKRKAWNRFNSTDRC